MRTLTKNLLMFSFILLVNSFPSVASDKTLVVATTPENKAYFPNEYQQILLIHQDPYPSLYKLYQLIQY